MLQLLPRAEQRGVERRVAVFNYQPVQCGSTAIPEELPSNFRRVDDMQRLKSGKSTEIKSRVGNA